MNFFDVLYALREDTINGYLHSKHRQTDDIIRKIYNLFLFNLSKLNVEAAVLKLLVVSI